ncbi:MULTISPECIES: TetR family transcriptional regulator [unclassified Rhizobium]|uniref:TetR family transcriptional regulator n=1 Tax=unclassified Rhizobium TaxID=2613769 RepID=UPI0016148DB5|nr:MULTISPECIES: TetR family transcriptional regulator [unclassified Rhizobium]MBB3291175.1 AcrR family transcriptional regulator [Rhizobium sp. BK252]MBB3404163.1 AcrR family transcriptional regulator [Rhizobium sp. BK289]MBB3418485.1 AcrR family transcriptional regulator [Rhizobium sp. BK284]MBB3486363.1 AcrR family transcriptional regulator [Rhizobium sp. BK347]MDK4724076.1 TetR family transcriptional regulator [Rhizobium sp. CNPSo 3968]
MLDLSDVSADPARQENITRILDAAEKLFRHYGYSKTNVADIARDLGMSTANIYRFFGSKTEIHQAICGRMLGQSYQMALGIRNQPISATERLRAYALSQYKMILETMLDEQKVHEMVIVAIERDWHVIEKHIERTQALVAEIIAEGIAAGEFAEQDPHLAAKCFAATTVDLCHPQMVAQCLAKSYQADPEDIIAFVIRALKK